MDDAIAEPTRITVTVHPTFQGAGSRPCLRELRTRHVSASKRGDVALNDARRVHSKSALSP
jgi:hypothetical protein